MAGDVAALKAGLQGAFDTLSQASVTDDAATLRATLADDLGDPIAEFVADSITTTTPAAHATTHEPGGADPMAVDAAAATGSLRTLGSGAAQACAGNDSRLSDSRAPTGAAGGQLGGTYPNPDVRGLRETGGPTELTMGAVSDGEILIRSGSELIGATPSFPPYPLTDLEDIATDRLIGRDTAGSGSPEELTVGGGIEFTGSGGIQTSALTGDVTKAAGGTVTTIPADTVTDAKLANMGALSVKARALNSTGDPADLAAVAGTGYPLKESGSALVFAALTADGLAADAVTTAKILNANVTTAKIADDNVTFAKLQNLNTDVLVGRDTASTGDAEQITVGGGLEFTGAGGIQRSALTGDVTASAGSGSTSIANDAVTYAKMQNVSAASRVLGRGSGAGAGDPEELTVSSPLTVGAASLGFDSSANLDNNARVAVRKNSTGGGVGTRRRLNFIEGTGVTLTIADDSGNEEVDITIDASGGSGLTHAQVMSRVALRF